MIVNKLKRMITMQSIRAISALILREMISTYGRHVGGYAWAIIEPIAALALLSIVFSIAFRAPALGDNFPLFYATGYLPFMLYNDVSAKVAQSIKFSKPLLFYPPVTFAHAILARFILNVITHCLIILIIMAGIIQLFDYRAPLNFIPMLNSISMAAALGIGVGTLNCYASTRFLIWDRFWSILNRPALIVSGIFFIPSTLPEPYRTYVLYNPMIHVVGEMRKGFYPTYSGNYVSGVYVYLFACICFLIGLILLNRYHRVLINSY